MFKRIPISGKRGKGKYALIDADMHPALSKYTWWLSGHGYAKTEIMQGGKRKALWMHRMVMDCPDYLVTHHINGISLDNRRCNLRNVTQQQNTRARTGQGQTSCYKGVFWDNTRRRWVARVVCDGKIHHAGVFHSERAAAAAYNDLAIQLFGKHARLNDLHGTTDQKNAIIERYTRGDIPLPKPLPLPRPNTSRYVRLPLSGKLGHGKYALIDAADLPLVQQYRWWYSRQGYAAGHTMIDGCKTHLKMHRLILAAPHGSIVDHINGNGLDNRRENLRLVTHSQNMHNSKSHKKTFKGVYRKGNGWQASITVNREQIYLGFFDTQRDAAAAYNEAAKKYHGEYARLNDLSTIDPQDDPPIRTKQTSKYKGVGYHKKQRKWNAYAFVNGQQVSIGSFDTEQEAALARDRYVIGNGLSLKLNILTR